MRKAFVALLIAGVLLAGWASATLAGSIEEQTLRLAAELRCPVCQNLSVADSPSEMAIQMRELIYEKMKQGESPEQIRSYFVSRYGEWILLAPTRQGFNWLAWLLPFVAILAGLGVIVLTIRRSIERSHRSNAEQLRPPDPRYASRLEAELKEMER
ncbi:cytochrome c-type biogenesis protein [Candidatus Methylomirabilis sp.]|uniref:Cytochrome c-type biogenesis protein n=1 Tax=Candidatus Methylomirabilis tolerans TaxID=3123416 RepID=A0AAJ1AHV7_9BACT|nr:cytochrome c-type biogenesis protein CcmH [Candidatus Methylomirabilis sp.]